MDHLMDRQTILIVDDMPTNIHLLAGLLKEEWNIKVATNGKDALRIAQSSIPPDLILLDIMMPEIDGYEVCKKLKEEKDTRDIPVIFITAISGEKAEVYGLNLGAIDYITKPFCASIVKARVKNHLELKGYRDMLKKISIIDSLTGIANRRQFNERMAIEWRRAYRTGAPLSLIILDIDFFKDFNDEYGHIEGDKCLQRVASTLKNAVKRPGDLIARWGGEEFICLLPETDYKGALQVAEKLRNSIVELNISNKASRISKRVTISLGTATIIPVDKDHWEILLQRADEALFIAKGSGRNCVRSYMI